MTGILCMATVVAAVYFVYVAIACKGIPESLSATYYLLGNKGWLFQLVMGMTGLLLLPVWVSVSEECLQHLAFFACGGLLFTAVAPAFRLKLEGAVHYSAAVVCCVSAILWQVMEGLWDITLFFAILGWVCYLQWKNWCFWLEVAVTGSVMANLWRLV